MTPRRLSRWLGWAFALTLVGYPLAGLFAVFLRVPSWGASYPFRFAVVAISVWLLVHAAGVKPHGRLPPLVAVFWTLYVVRLLVDAVSGPPGALEALVFFVITTLVPVLTLVRAAPHWDESNAARAVFVLGSAICIGGVLLGTGLIRTDRQFDHSSQLFLDTVNPISFGHVAVSTLIAAGALAYRTPRTIPGPLLAAGAAAALGCLTVAGARGPVVALAVCALALALVQRRLGMLLMLAAAGTFVVSMGDVEVVARFQGLESVEGDASALERLVLQANAIEIFLANPVLGGAFAEFALNTYPHNVFIETAMALGVVGLLLIGALTLLAIARGYTLLRHRQVLLPLLFMQYFIGFQLSGALWGASAFWACLALLLWSRRAPRRALDRASVGPLLLPAPATAR